MHRIIMPGAREDEAKGRVMIRLAVAGAAGAANPQGVETPPRPDAFRSIRESGAEGKILTREPDLAKGACHE